MIWIHNTGWINKTAGSSLHSTICTVPLWHQFHFNYLSFPVSFLHFSAALYHSGRGGKLPYNYFCSFSLLSGLLIQNLLVFPIPKGFCGSPFLWFLVASVFEKHTNFSAEMALQPSFALLVILTPSWKQVDFPRLKMRKTESVRHLKIAVDNVNTKSQPVIPKFYFGNQAAIMFLQSVGFLDKIQLKMQLQPPGLCFGPSFWNC